MDEELKAYLDALMRPLNTKLDDILDKLVAVRSDTDNTKGHLIFVMQDALTLGQRVTKLEEELRQRRES